VLDFGIATDAGVCDPQPDGTVLGTPAYLAPERLCGRPVTVATDMYGLGVVLYQCLTGRLPWKPATGALQPYVPRHGSLDPLPEIDGLAPEVADLCARCLSRDPEERPSSLVAALVLAEAVDARVYVPPVEMSAAWPMPGSARDRAVDVPTAAAALDIAPDVPVRPVADGGSAGAGPSSGGSHSAGPDGAGSDGAGSDRAESRRAGSPAAERFDKLRDPTFDAVGGAVPRQSRTG
jgi:serine/threonine-protein kinase